MNPAVLRLSILIAAGSLLAACGGSEPAPVSAPEPAITEAVDIAPVGDDAHDEDGDDHDDERATGGTAHVHGHADLAITREGNKILGELISPMANFGLAESDGAFTDVVTAELSGLVELQGGECTAAVPHPMTDNSGNHTDGIVHFVWTCAKPGEVTAVRFAGFAAFPSFETVNTLYITDTAQKVGELTPSAPELSLK